jgi:hypothetical protein
VSAAYVFRARCIGTSNGSRNAVADWHVRRRTIGAGRRFVDPGTYVEAVLPLDAER